MEPLRLVVPGQFVDSQIYKGLLYLWCLDGSLWVLDWQEVIQAIRVPGRLELARDCGFLWSHLLYGQKRLLLDAEMHQVLRRKFDDLARQVLEVDQISLVRATRRKIANPFPFPHSDCLLYSDHLYVSGKAGVAASWVGGQSEAASFPASPTRLWGGPIIGLSAGRLRVALSASSDGLFEIPALKRGWHGYSTEDGARISALPSSSTRQAFASLFSTSPLHGGYFVYRIQRRSLTDSVAEAGAARATSFDLPDDAAEPRSFPGELQTVGVETAERLFARRAFSWGSQDKLCQIDRGKLRLIRYSPRKKYDQLSAVEEVAIPAQDVEPISADSALFGFVLEHDDHLLVLRSEGDPYRIEGEPIHWRVFPRSKHYENQLHVIREECLEVFSFNHDFFVDQKTKVFGLEALPERRAA